jgi:hypothetical protein
LVPDVVDVEPVDGTFDVCLHTYPTEHLGVGSLFRPEVGDNEEYFLVGTERARFTLSRSQLREFLELEVCPLRVDGTFHWSDSVDVDSL